MKKSLTFGIIALIITFSFCCQPVGAADTWPKGKKITCLVPFAAGGSVDNMARQLLKYWEPALGTTMLVTNRDGASGLLGTEVFLKQPKDGSYVFIATQPYQSAGIILQGAKYSLDDFAAINFQQFDPVTVAVHADSDYKTWDDLLADIKARPGQVKCGTQPGGAPHLGSIVIQERFGADYREVMYDSGNGYRTALLGRHVDFVVSTSSGDRSLGDKGRVLAIFGSKRSVTFPDTPTFNEIMNVADFPNLGAARLVAVHKELKQKYPQRFQKLVETYKKAYEDPAYVKFRETSGESSFSNYYGPEESDKINQEIHKTFLQYKSRIEALNN